EGGHHLDHGDGGLGGFAASVQFVPEGSGLGLLRAGDEEDFVDDGNEVGGAGVLQAAGDRPGDEVGVGGGASDDDAEGEDGERLVLGGGEGLDDDGNLEGTGDADDANRELGRELREGGGGGLDEGVGETGVVAARDDGD